MVVVEAEGDGEEVEVEEGGPVDDVEESTFGSEEDDFSFV